MSAGPNTSDSQALSNKSGGRGTGMWVALAVILIVIIVVVVGFAAGWFSTKSSTPPPATCTGASCQQIQQVCDVNSGQMVNASSTVAPVSITGAGSTFVYPLMYTWTTTYTSSTVGYSSVGSGTGISDLGAKTVDFAASDAPLSPSQQATDPGAIEMPESAGAVAIIYNLPGVPQLHFNGTVLADIYLGTITTWNDPAIAALNPTATLPSASIIVVHRNDGSGTSFAFTEYLSSQSSKWASTVGYETAPTWPVGTGEKGSGGVAGYVQETTYTIGYVDLEYALENGISFGAVQNPAGNFIVPSLNSTANSIKDHTAVLPAATDVKDWYNVSIQNEPGANDYPISTFTYLMSYADLNDLGSSFTSQQASAMISFWNWTIHQGQLDSGGLYYVPLPANIVTADQAELSSFTYNGAAVAHC